jgi:hypothetical protein
MFNWRRIELDDYPMLCEWWAKWGWPQPPSVDMLPSTGVLVYDEVSGTPLYAGFLYTTGTTMGWFEYVVNNRDADISMKRGALQYLSDTISVIAKDRGVVNLFTSTNNPAYCVSLKKCNFQVGDENMVQLIRKL